MPMKPAKAGKNPKREGIRRVQIDMPKKLAAAYRIDCLQRGTTMRDDIIAHIETRVGHRKPS